MAPTSGRTYGTPLDTSFRQTSVPSSGGRAPDPRQMAQSASTTRATGGCPAVAHRDADADRRPDSASRSSSDPHPIHHVPHLVELGAAPVRREHDFVQLRYGHQALLAT